VFAAAGLAALRSNGLCQGSRSATAAPTWPEGPTGHLATTTIVIRHPGERRGIMKRLILLTLLIVLPSSGAQSEGVLYIFTEQTSLDNSATLMPYVPTDLCIVYYGLTGVDDWIISAQFKVALPGDIVITNFTPDPDVSFVEGAVDSNLTCTFNDCIEDGTWGIFIGTITVLNLNTDLKVLEIVEAENLAEEPYKPRVTVCDGAERIVTGVRGWRFCTIDGPCYTSTEQSSWGAIKTIYRD